MSLAALTEPHTPGSSKQCNSLSLDASSRRSRRPSAVLPRKPGGGPFLSVPASGGASSPGLTVSSSLSPSSRGLSVWGLRHPSSCEDASPILRAHPNPGRHPPSSSHLQRPEVPGGHESGAAVSPADHVSAAGVLTPPLWASLSGVPRALALDQVWGSYGHCLQEGCSGLQTLSSKYPETPPSVASWSPGLTTGCRAWLLLERIPGYHAGSAPCSVHYEGPTAPRADPARDTGWPALSGTQELVSTVS